MMIKVYVSEVSGSNEIRERQQTIILALKSNQINYQLIDITVDKNEKIFMQNNSKYFGGTSLTPHPIYPLPPQIFNDDIYCGDYEKFEIANENKELNKFLRLI